MTVRRLPALLVTLACLGGPATGCSAQDGPGRSSPDPGSSRAAGPGAHRAQCTTSDAEGELIVHPGTVTVDVTTRLESVSLIEAVNLEVVEESVTAFGGDPGVRGIIRDYPPLENAGLADSLADWDERRALAGLEVRRDDGPQAVLVALRLVDPARSGHLVGVRLTSSASGERTTRDLVQPVLVEPPGALCTIDEVDATLGWTPPRPT